MLRIHTNSGKDGFPDVSSSKTALVTGGAGFLGSHLCRRLLNERYQVLCLDDFSTGLRRNIDAMRSHPRFDLINRNVTEALELDDFQIDEIYNLACPASPPLYQRDPIETVKTNVIGAINVLELGRRKGAVVFQASTSEVYGDPLVHPQGEDYCGNVNSIGPRACYDEGKRCAETLFFDYARHHGVPIKVVRIFNTYGPNMRPDDGRVVSNFIIQALRNEAITIYGDGDQTRSFCYVDDLIDGFREFMQTPRSMQGPLNLGNPAEFTIRELADLVIEKTGSSSRIVHLEKPTDDPRQRRPDISKAHEMMGWKPTVSLEEGLDRTIHHFDALLSDRSPFVLEAAE